MEFARILAASLPRFASVTVLAALLSACGGGGNDSVGSGNSSSGGNSGSGGNGSNTPPTGSVVVGAVPVAGASVSAYSASSAGPVLLAQATTDSQGSFTFAHVIPASAGLVYLVAVGGDAGGGSNNGSVMMTVAGQACDTTTAGCQFPTSLTINPLTTVAAAYSLSAFAQMSGGSLAVSGKSPGLPNAALTFAQLIDPAHGAASAALSACTGTNCTALQKLNTLADILGACVTGGASSAACTNLFSVAGHSSDTFSAALNIALVASVRNNGAGIYGLAPATASYTPALSAAPGDWTLTQTFTGGGMNAPYGIAVDADGSVWVANEIEPGTLSKFSSAGQPLSPAAGFTGGGLNGPLNIAIDAQGAIWVANWASGSGRVVSKFNATGTPLSASGYTAGGLVYGPTALAPDSSGNIWVANYGDSRLLQLDTNGNLLNNTASVAGGLKFPIALAIDGQDNIWIANQGGDSVSEFTSAMIAVSGSNGYQGPKSPSGLAIDATGNAWVSSANTNTVIELWGGNTAPAAGCPVSPMQGDTGCMVTSGFAGGGLAGPNSVAIDGAGRVWVSNFHGPSISELGSDGSVLSPSGGYGQASLSLPYGVAVDASGNLWVTSTGSNSMTKFIGIAAPVKTPRQGVPVAP